MKNWKVPTLARRALLRDHLSHNYWSCVDELPTRGGDEVFVAATELCRKRNNACRTLGADILGQLGPPNRPYREASLEVLWALLVSTRSPQVISAALIALGHLQEESDTRKVRLVASYATHASQRVRLGVASALFAKADRTSISTLIHLSRDRVASVRDWATFGLGAIELDSPRIRAALLDRLDDPDADTRCEALLGLAKSKSPMVRERLVAELEKEAPTSLVFEAVEELGDPTLLPLMKRHLHSMNDEVYSLWAATLEGAYEALSKNG